MKSLLFLQGFFKKSNMLLKANPLFTRAFKRLSADSLLKSFLFLSLYSVGAKASMVPIDPCQNPLEIAALFSNMKQPTNTLEGQIKKKEGLLEKRQKLLNMLMEGDGNYNLGIEGYIDDLSNSLDKNTFLEKDELNLKEIKTKDGKSHSPDKKYEKVYNVAADLASYIESQESGWDCEEGGKDHPCRAWQKRRI